MDETFVGTENVNSESEDTIKSENGENRSYNKAVYCQHTIIIFRGSTADEQGDSSPQSSFSWKVFTGLLEQAQLLVGDNCIS